MRSTLLVTLLAFVLAAPPFAGGEKPLPCDTTLPGNPFADARLGDWSAHHVTVRHTDRKGRAREARALLTHEVVAVTSETVTVRVEQRARDGDLRRPARDAPFSRLRAPKAEEILGLVAEAKDDHARTIVAFRSDDARIALTIAVPNVGEEKATLVLAKTVRASGIESWTSQLAIDDGRHGTFTTTWSLAGSGGRDDDARRRALVEGFAATTK